MFRIQFAAVGLLSVGLCGCGEWPQTGAKDRTGALGVTTQGIDDLAKPAAPPQERKGVVGQTTSDIGKFDPNAKQEVSQQKIQASDPITAPLAAYGPMVERISITEMDHAVRLFHASEGRYPKDYDEFMARIVAENRIKLPVLPFGGKYQYDEANHTLQIVRPAQNQK
jgi:hypothetical protein